MVSVDRYTRRVKRWRGGGMIQVRGYRDLPLLARALDALAPPDGAVTDAA